MTANSMNLLFAINKNFIPLFGSCARSIAKNGGYDSYEAYIIQSDFDEDAKADVQKEAGEHFHCHFVDMDPTIFADFPESKRYPQQIYYRLAAPLLLPKELERILYLDVDLVVINSLKELYDSDFEGNYYIACSHTKEILTRINQLRLSASDEAPYVNTGVLLMNLQALRDQINLSSIKKYVEEKFYTLLLPDQDILTALYGDHIKLVDTMKYNLSDRLLILHNAKPGNPKLDEAWVRKNAVILHFCGKNKPWKDTYIGVLGSFYWELNPKVSVKIAHVALYVKDLEKAKDFFVNYLNGKSNEGYHNKTTNFRSYFISFENGTRLELMTRPELVDIEKSPMNMGYSHIAFSLGSKAAVDNLTAKLKADGYEVLSGPRTTGDGYYESCIVALEGNLIELCE